MIAGLIGAGLGLAGSIYGGIKASQAMKGVKKDLEARKRANDAWYEREYNRDVTQRADAQNLLSRTRELLRDRGRQAAGAQAVMGGTDESVASQKMADAETLAGLTGRIASQGDAHRDRVESMYRQRDAQLSDGLNSLEVGKAQQLGAAGKELGQFGQDVADLF